MGNESKREQVRTRAQKPQIYVSLLSITDLLVTTEKDHQLHKHWYSCHEHCTLL
jgi:hypothetical protein